MANDVVDEAAVYLTTGNPLPADIESIINWLLNEPFVTAFQSKSGVTAATGMGGSDGRPCWTDSHATTECSQQSNACSADVILHLLTCGSLCTAWEGHAVRLL